MAKGNYIGFGTQEIAEAFQARLFIAAGYTGSVPANVKTSRYGAVYVHPEAASRPGQINFLIVVKEVQMWGPRRRQSPDAALMTDGEKTLIKTAAEWEVDGFFPPEARE